MIRATARGGLLVLFLAALVGCPETSGVPVEYVEGVVTLDGKPIEGVNVGFSPTKAGSGTPAVGTTDANGVFTLTATAGGKPGGGAGIGEYNVTFSEVKTSGQASQVTKSTDPDYGKGGTNREPTKMEYIVPQKYEDATTSGFTVSVVDGTNKGDKFKFDLKSE